MNGADILLFVNTGTNVSPTWTAVGSQRGVTFEETSAAIDMSSKDSRWGRVIAGRAGATLTMDGLYVPSDGAYLALQTAQRAGDLIRVRAQEEGAYLEEAYAHIDSMSKEGPDQDAAVISISLTIDGEWSTVGT